MTIDIFLIWEHGMDKLNQFINHLNSVHNTIKFSCDHSITRVNFLDTWVIKTPDGSIQTDLYTKPTDSNNYLWYTSAHLSHCKQGIPYGQFLRRCISLSQNKQQSWKKLTWLILRINKHSPGHMGCLPEVCHQGPIFQPPDLHHLRELSRDIGRLSSTPL